MNCQKMWSPRYIGISTAFRFIYSRCASMEPDPEDEVEVHDSPIPAGEHLADMGMEMERQKLLEEKKRLEVNLAQVPWDAEREGVAVAHERVPNDPIIRDLKIIHVIISCGRGGTNFRGGCVSLSCTYPSRAATIMIKKPPSPQQNFPVTIPNCLHFNWLGPATTSIRPLKSDPKTTTMIDRKIVPPAL